MSGVSSLHTQKKVAQVSHCTVCSKVCSASVVQRTRFFGHTIRDTKISFDALSYVTGKIVLYLKCWITAFSETAAMLMLTRWLRTTNNGANGVLDVRMRCFNGDTGISCARCDAV